MATETLTEQIRKQTERLAATMLRQIEKDNAAAARAAATAARQKTLADEKQRVVERLAKEEKKRVDAKRAHIFYRVILEAKGFGYGWILEALRMANASEGVMAEFPPVGEKPAAGVVSAKEEGAGKSDEQAAGVANTTGGKNDNS